MKVKALLLTAAVGLYGAMAHVASPALADPLAWDALLNDDFGKLDLASGALAQIGVLAVGASGPAGLGEIGSTVYTASIFGTGFYTVNTATAGVTLISNVGLGGNNYYNIGSTTSGLYGLDGSYNLYSINPHTGVATLIGSTGLSFESDAAYSLSNGSSTLYLTNGQSLYTLNTSTGAPTYVGDAGAPPIGFGADVYENGELYAVDYTSPGDTIYTLNTATSAGTFVTDTSYTSQSYGLAPVPEPPTWAMLLAGFAGLGFADYRSRKGVSIAA